MLAGSLSNVFPNFPVIFAGLWSTKNAKGGLCILFVFALITLSNFYGLTSKIKTLYPRSNATEREKPRVMLTMFTSFKNKKEKYQTYCNTLRNLALFRPQIQPILFTYETDERLIKLAKSLGWIVAEIPRLGKIKLPIWKDMYFAAQNRSDSLFYSWFNGDILFDDGLIKTLTTIEQYLNQLNKPLIVGRRVNFDLRDRELWNKSDVTEAAKKGQLHANIAIDYFILARNQFIWDKVPDIVIGRSHYDVYLVYLAVKNKLSVVDATKTILALHQTGKDGNNAGITTNKDWKYNVKILPNFDIYQGGADRTPLYTEHGNGNEKIEIWQRPMRERAKLSKLMC